MVFDIHPAVRINTYGHIGDGNIHHKVLPPERVSKADFIAANPGINEATAQFDGSISAEHGIGRLKPTDLETFADPAKLYALRSIKAALDPNNIMNPGAMLIIRE